MLGTYQPGEFIFQCLIFLPFHTVLEVLKARILVCRFLLLCTFCQNAMTRPSWVALYGKAHSFIELDKAVVYAISLVSFP